MIWLWTLLSVFSVPSLSAHLSARHDADIVVEGEQVWMHDSTSACYFALLRAHAGGSWIRRAWTGRGPFSAPHPDALGFLRAIGEEPEDDTVRLAYADWLDEHGQSSYAAFIRASIAFQVERLRLEPRPQMSPFWASHRQTPLETTFHSLRHELMPRSLGGAHRYGWRRGMIEWLDFVPANFVKYGDEVLSALPTAKTLQLSFHRTDSLADVFSVKALREVKRLVLDSASVDFRQLGPILARCTFLAQLRELELDVFHGDMGEFLREVRLPELTRLVVRFHVRDDLVGQNPRPLPVFRPEDFGSLAVAFPKLKDLVLDATDSFPVATNRALEILMRSPLQLERLTLQLVLPGVVSLRTFADAPSAEFLRLLHLGYRPTESDLDLLSNSPYLRAPLAFEAFAGLLRSDSLSVSRFRDRFGPDSLSSWMVGSGP